MLEDTPHNVLDANLHLTGRAGGFILSATSPVNAPAARPIPLTIILLIAFIVHGPLLLMELPQNSFDTNFHESFASHYAHHWFNPWNTKWYAGFSQTTYPPLPQQWVALFSHVMGLELAYMLVQFIAILLLVVGVYRFSRLWVDERSASYAALGAVFLGSLSMLVYEAGQLSTTSAIPLYLLALPYFHEWTRRAKFGSLLKGLALTFAAAAAHNATLLFGAFLFALPVFALAVMDRNRDGEERSLGGAVSRAVVFAVLSGIGIAAVLLPFWLALLQYPITQIPIPHASRSNYILNPVWGVEYWVIPYGALILALPFIVIRGASDRRLRPLLFAFWISFLLGLGGTTPVGHWLLRRAYDVITMERFSFWATLLALPLVGSLAAELIDRFHRKALVGLTIAAGATCAFAIGWLTFHPINADSPRSVAQTAAFLNRDGHDRYRYITLGFGNKISRLSVLTDADSVDGEWNSERRLPELTQYGAAQLTNSKYFGTAGIDALRAMLKHADKYGLKWVFLRDPYYEPLLVFAGWRKVDNLTQDGVSVWSKDDVPPATPIVSATIPAPWEGLLWGTLPIGSSILALVLVILLPERRTRGRRGILTPFPEPAESALLEAK